MIWIVVAFAVGVLLLATQVNRSKMFWPKGPGILQGDLISIDQKALANLFDPEQESFLRSTLAQREYRTVRRLRVAARIGYVSAMFTNAGVLMRTGAALEVASPEAAMRTKELLRIATELRMNCLAALILLHAQYWLPVGDTCSGRATARYRDLVATSVWASATDYPQLAAQLSATLG